MRPSRNQQINRALALLDRVIALIEAEDSEPVSPISNEPIVPADISSRIRCRSPYWKDAQVRSAILSLYGRCSINDASAILISEFGAERAPGRSALGRIYAVIAEASLRAKEAA